MCQKASTHRTVRVSFLLFLNELLSFACVFSSNLSLPSYPPFRSRREVPGRSTVWLAQSCLLLWVYPRKISLSEKPPCQSPPLYSQSRDFPPRSTSPLLIGWCEEKASRLAGLDSWFLIRKTGWKLSYLPSCFDPQVFLEVTIWIYEPPLGRAPQRSLVNCFAFTRPLASLVPPSSEIKPAGHKQRSWSPSLLPSLRKSLSYPPLSFPFPRLSE